MFSKRDFKELSQQNDLKPWCPSETPAPDGTTVHSTSHKGLQANLDPGHEERRQKSIRSEIRSKKLKQECCDYSCEICEAM